MRAAPPPNVSFIPCRFLGKCFWVRACVFACVRVCVRVCVHKSSRMVGSFKRARGDVRVNKNVCMYGWMCTTGTCIATRQGDNLYVCA